MNQQLVSLCCKGIKMFNLKHVGARELLWDQTVTETLLAFMKLQSSAGGSQR